MSDSANVWTIVLQAPLSMGFSRQEYWNGLLCPPPVQFSSVQFSSVTQSRPTLCDPMNRSMPGLPVHHQLLEFTQTHVHRVRDAIQPSHPWSFPSPPASNRELPNVQAGFRKGRGTRDQIANVRWIMEKAREFQKNIYFCFINYAKA